MSLPSASIKRPVTTLMAYLGVFLFGFISLSRLSQELFPPITYPQLSIVTPYENAAPEEIETLITKPIEEAVGGIAGLRKVSSTSREGLSLVIVEFGWSQSMDFASLAVREKIDLIKERLPRDASEPVVIKFNPFEMPVMSLSISSSERSSVQLREISKRWFKDELEKIHGVASASMSGGAEEQILVDVDQGKLQTAGVGLNEVTDALTAGNLNYPGGTIKESFYEYLIRTLGEFKHINEVGELPIRRINIKQGRFRGGEQNEDPSNKLIFLKDVADISRTVKERTSYSRFNGRENVTIAVQKQASGNAIQIASEIRKRLKELQEQLPKDIHVDIIYDQSKFISEALHGVSDSAVQGGFLAFLVLLIFLRDFRSSVLVVLITPVTILATYTLMYFLNISLNVISLGGLALGVGMLLDNAVCVIENIYRKFREKPEAGIAQAAIDGSEEVMAPMVASTLTTVSVFLPIVFVTGIAGQIFKQLAWVVVVTQVISAIIAFTLLPMLIVAVGKNSSLTKRDIHDEGKAKFRFDKSMNVFQLWNSFFEYMLNICSMPIHAIEAAYIKLLPAFFKKKWFYMALIFSLFFGSLTVMSKMDKILLPKVDQGQFMIKLDLPVGSRIEFTNSIAEKIERFLKVIPEVKHVSVVVGSSKGSGSKEVVERLGSHQAQIIVALEEERERATDEVVQDVRRYFEISKGRTDIYPARISYVLYDSAFKTGSENDAPVIIDVKGPKLEELERLSHEIQEKLNKIKGIYGVTDSIAEPFPETKIIINKDRASYYRFTVTQVAQAANIAIKGFTPSKFKEEGKEIDIRVQLKPSDRDKLEKLKTLNMHTSSDINIPISDFVKFQTGKGPSEIKRVSQERTVQVFAKVYGRSMKEINAEVQSALDNTKMEGKYYARIAGESEEIKDSFDSLTFAFMLSIVLVYMIMAAQFESLWQPFLIMFCVPLSLIGVSFALWVSNTPLSVVVILGIILLAGIVVNNGIILIDYINQLRREEGLSLEAAATKAGKTRLRPILMTAFSSAIGVAPLAFGIGEGDALQAPMAKALMGGILLATFLSLVVTPSLYVGTNEIFGKWFGSKKPKSNPTT